MAWALIQVQLPLTYLPFKLLVEIPRNHLDRKTFCCWLSFTMNKTVIGVKVLLEIPRNHFNKKALFVVTMKNTVIGVQALLEITRNHMDKKALFVSGIVFILWRRLWLVYKHFWRLPGITWIGRLCLLAALSLYCEEDCDWCTSTFGDYQESHG